jgi:D-cysteine desulfhydrase
MSTLALEAVDRLPRLHWVEAPTPVVELPELAERFGLSWIGAKRDDRLPKLGGGTKVRKLDFALADGFLRDCERFASAGAIGSGHLVACARAAELLGKRVVAHLFWEPLSLGVVANLAHTCSGPTELQYHGSRLGLVFSAPAVVLGTERTSTGVPVLPPGATCVAGMLGTVRAGLELAEQVRQGLLPEPQRLYVALGSGGTALGLALGLALGGLKSEVRAVATVERPLASAARLRRLLREIRQRLSSVGVDASLPVRCVRDFSQVGPGYGRATAAAMAAVAETARLGLHLEPVYTGKAFAALLADAVTAREHGTPLGPVLFWCTVRAHGDAPADPDWRQRLPPTLRNRLDLAEADVARSRWPRPAPAWPVTQGLEAATLPSRRWFLLGTAAVATVGMGVARAASAPELADWKGESFDAGEAALIAAMAEALLPPAPPLRSDVTGLAAWSPVAVAADVYVSRLPRPLRRLTHLALFALAQSAPSWSTLAAVPVAERRATLQGLCFSATGCALHDCGRDLVMLGYYQQAACHAAIGYPGPAMPAEPRPRRPAYARLAAAPGTLPATALR